MKKFIVLICCIALGFVAKAQKLEGSVDVLLNESRVDFELSFAKASIHGMSEAEFAKYATDWNKDMPQIIGYFVDDLNDEINGLVRFGSYPTAKYKLVVEVIEVSVDGGLDSDVYLLDNTGKELAKITRLVASGGTFGIKKIARLIALDGTFGTKIALIKDGAKHSGIVLGKFLLKELKKAKKIKKKEGR